MILDVGNPGNPRQVGSLALEGQFEELDVVGSLAYAVGSGVAILDVSDPTRPIVRGRSTQGGGGSLDVTGDMVCTVGGSINMLRVKDVEYPITLPLIRR